MTIKEYTQNVINDINSSLDKYLSLKGLTPGKLRCPNTSAHKRGDKNPSANTFKGDSGDLVWHCHTCNAGHDTIAMAHYLDNLPEEGPGFIRETIPKLCEMLDIEWQPEKYLDPIHMKMKKMQDVIDDLSAYSISNLEKLYDNEPNNEVVEYLTNRGIYKEDLQVYEIGHLIYDDATKYLVDKGYTKDILESLNLRPNDNKSVHNRMMTETSFILTLRSGETSRGVAFASHDVTYDGNGAKYINSPNSDIFTKNKYLYGLDKSRKYIRNSGEVEIVEGYMDFISLHKSGKSNVVAICGIAFTNNHLEILLNYNIRSIVMALDSDDAGRSRTISIMEKLFSETKIVKPFVRELPEDSDPDDVVKYIDTEDKTIKYNLTEYESHVPMSIISYRIKHTFSEDSINIDEDVTTFLRWLVRYETNHLKQIRYLDEISEYTGITTTDLRKQLEFEQKMISDKYAHQVEQLKYDLIKSMRNTNTDEVIQSIDKFKDSLVSLRVSEEVDIIGQQLESINEVEEEFRNSTIKPIKFNIAHIDDNVIIPKDSSLIVVGARANVGKSILTANLSIAAIRNNEDMGVIYFSMDDAKKKTMARLCANQASIRINDIRYQNILPQGPDKTRKLSKIREGFNSIKELVKSNRLSIYDQSDVLDIGGIASLIDLNIELMKQKGLIPLVVIDSLHSITNPTATDGIRADVMSHIRKCKTITNTRGIPMIAVVEFRKSAANNGGSSVPSLQDIAETADIEYRVDIGIVLHDSSRTDDGRIWTHEDFPNTQFPVLEMHVQKNKEAGFRGAIPYKQNYEYCQILGIPNIDSDPSIIHKGASNISPNETQPNAQNIFG